MQIAPIRWIRNAFREIGDAVTGGPDRTTQAAVSPELKSSSPSFADRMRSAFSSAQSADPVWTVGVHRTGMRVGSMWYATQQAEKISFRGGNTSRAITPSRAEAIEDTSGPAASAPGYEQPVDITKYLDLGG